jgi:hypothetical protein
VKRNVRASSPADASAICAVLSEAGLSTNLAKPQQLHWKYWQERTDCADPRSYVITRGADIIAHAGIVPGTSISGARQTKVIHLIDWAARPAEIGAGVGLLKHVSQLCDAIFSVGGSTQTLQILPRIGFQSFGCVKGYVRTLHPVRLLRSVENAGWKLLPRFGRSVLWTVSASWRLGRDWQVRRLCASDARTLVRVLPTSTREMTVLERSEGLFSHALMCPLASMGLYAVEKADRLRGYFVLAFVPAQARLADCWMDSGDPADWRALVQCAVLQAKLNPSAAELIAWANDPTLSRALRECGFHERCARPLLLLPNAPATLRGILRVQMLDNDDAYLHGTRPDLWA